MQNPISDPVARKAISDALAAMRRIYAAGYERITQTGVDCDTPEYMMAGDPTAIELQALLDAPAIEVKPAAYLDLWKLSKGMAYATPFRASEAQVELFSASATITLGDKSLGNYGSLYDGPSVRRAYTYKHQPGNEAAHAMGVAAQATGIGGDAIDKGLKLLCELERAGYGVFAI